MRKTKKFVQPLPSRTNQDIYPRRYAFIYSKTFIALLLVTTYHHPIYVVFETETTRGKGIRKFCICHTYFAHQEKLFSFWRRLFFITLSSLKQGCTIVEPVSQYQYLMTLGCNTNININNKRSGFATSIPISILVQLI